MELSHRNRIRIAQLSAQIILEEGVNDYAIAKRKAAQRLGLNWGHNLPDNQTIEEAVREYHRIFRFQHQSDFIRRLREIALEAMAFLEDFSPRLVGSVLEGTAGDYSPITLHLFPDTPEAVIWKLIEAEIPYQEVNHLVAAEPGAHGEGPTVPGLTFEWEGWVIETRLYPPKALRQAPKHGARRASIKALRRLLAESDLQA
ncbi:MAG: hypothetical protein Kow0060_17420 [Methylohalobius crimeensis]